MLINYPQKFPKNPKKKSGLTMWLNSVSYFEVLFNNKRGKLFRYPKRFWKYLKLFKRRKTMKARLATGVTGTGAGADLSRTDVLIIPRKNGNSLAVPFKDSPGLLLLLRWTNCSFSVHGSSLLDPLGKLNNHHRFRLVHQQGFITACCIYNICVSLLDPIAHSIYLFIAASDFIAG